MPRLSEPQFLATARAAMARAMGEAPPFDFWPYFDAIPDDDFEGFDCSAGEVTYVYRSPDERFEHVLVNSTDRDVFMVVVLDRTARTVVGHRLLDLPVLYGLRDDPV